MRLLSCHIAAFGRIREKDMTFTPGINCFLEPNGSGKSTTADFLCAMFYGMDGYTKSSVQFPERMHYFPAEAAGVTAVFGGSVTFEKDGAEYRIERFFGEKSVTADRLTVYKNGMETDELGDCPGIAVFGIDKESFARTAFYHGNAVTGGSTPDLNRALHGTVAAPEAGGTAEEAAKRLEDAAAKLQGKKRAGGQLAVLRKDLTDVSLRLLQLRETELTLEPLYQQRSELNSSLEQAGQMRKAATDWLALEGKQAVLREKQNAVTETEGKLREIDARYPAGVPGQDVTALLRTAGRLSETVGSPLEAGSPAAVFSGELPAEADYAETAEKIRRLVSLEQEKNALEHTVPSRTDSFSWEAFAEEDAESAAAEAERLAASLRSAEAELSARHTAMNGQARSAGMFLPSGIVLSVLALTFFLAGAFMKGSLAGVAAILFVLGGVSLAAGALLLCLPAIRRRKSAAAEEAELAGLEEKKAAVQSKLRALLSRFGYTGEDSLSEYAACAAEYQLYLKQKAETETIRERTAQIAGQAAELRAEIADFLSFHAISGTDLPGVELPGALHRAREKYDTFTACTKARAAAEGCLSRLSLPMPACGEEIAAATAMDTDRVNRSVLQSELEKKRTDAEFYRRETLPEAMPPKPEVSVDDADAKLRELNAQLAALDRRIEETESETAKIGEYEAREHELRERISETEHRAFVYLSAAKAIRDADNRLTEKYIAPVRERFDTYAGLLGSITGEKVIMDISYRVKTEHGGVYLDERYFSEGQKALCSLCLRLAMIDNIYKKEKPFLVFDDPFVGLDAEKMAKAARLLSELTDCQILYFCCHESRIIGKDA